ncbi:hypothetical protein [Sphingomonas koreensis]
MSFGRSLLIGIALALLVSWLFGAMMLDNNNQGEFADTVTGAWTPHFWMLMTIIAAAVAVSVTLLLTLIGFLRRGED